MVRQSEIEGQVRVDGTYLSFPAAWRVSVLDEWPQYRKPAGEIGLRGCDVVAVDGQTLGLIEMKDYTYPGTTPPRDLSTVIVQKAAGTIALLFALQRRDATSEAATSARACHDTTRRPCIWPCTSKSRTAGTRVELSPR